MASSADIEMRWVDAWSDLYEILGELPADPAPRCLLPDGTDIDVEECKGWLQHSVYEGFLVKVKPGWIRGRRGVIASRTKAEELSQ